MSKKPERRVRLRPKASRTSDVFSAFGCEEVTYTFDVPLQAFDLKRFYKETGIPPKGSKWSGIITAKEPSTGYHIHFDGTVQPRSAKLELRYYDGSLRTAADDSGPFAESLMPWLGAFFKEKHWRAKVSVQFEKSTEQWRSRFNLPFKVTMADTEVVIDGVTMDLPPNQFGAVFGWISRIGSKLTASVMLARRVEFASFNIADEIAEFNKAIKIFAEELKP